MGTGAWCCLQHVSVGQTWFRMSRLWSVVRPRSLPARDQENGRGAWRAAVPGTQNAFHVVSLLKPHSYGSGAGVARRGGAYFFYPPAVLRCMGAELLWKPVAKRNGPQRLAVVFLLCALCEWWWSRRSSARLAACCGHGALRAIVRSGEQESIRERNRAHFPRAPGLATRHTPGS